MKVNIDADDVQKKTTDDRGRFYLGSKYKDKEVEIAILDVEDKDG